MNFEDDLKIKSSRDLEIKKNRKAALKVEIAKASKNSVELKMALEKAKREYERVGGETEEINKAVEKMRSLLDSKDSLTEYKKKNDELVNAIEMARKNVQELDEVIKNRELHLTIEENKLKAKEKRIASLEKQKKELQEKNEQLISALRKNTYRKKN